ncbi:acetyltransferase [Paraburkholderia kirstenboschensis]|uniref:Acetyltransferase n=1 Tax=Paraburkholderia kirstenboschensis TaxID=1245436 RepID=A0ABZ0EN88_9BURK|nr:acetyltransferase [Paraburkholderia kirstenboschensis]WOD18649.1 acetyltransferase [Paraburkholderia kirstenboschensis]
MARLIIFGAGPFAQLVCRYATSDLGLQVQAFTVDEPYLPAGPSAIDGIPLLGWHAVCERYAPADSKVFVAVGYRSMLARERVYHTIKHSGYTLANLLHPAAWIARDVVIHDNVIVMPGAVIEPGVTLGANNVIWSNATACHDSAIGDHNFIAANATLGGNVTIGARNFIGFSAVLMQGRRVGDDTLIGAQTLIDRDTQDLCAYVGTPARLLRTLDPATGVTISDQC